MEPEQIVVRAKTPDGEDTYTMQVIRLTTAEGFEAEFFGPTLVNKNPTTLATITQIAFGPEMTPTQVQECLFGHGQKSLH